MGKRAVLVVAAGLVPLLLGCQSAGERCRPLLVSGEEAYLARDNARAVSDLSAYLTSVERGPDVPRALYVRGMAFALQGKRAWAYADLQRATREASDPQVTWRAYGALGVLHFEDGNWREAARCFGQAVRTAPDMPPADALAYRLGLSCERAGQWSDALTAFRRIVSVFPRGNYAELASRRLQLRADHFAVQCGVFSSAASANELAERLRAAGFRGEVRAELRGGAARQIVLVGRCAGYDEAVALLASVRSYVPDAVLWP